jgi:hypothetical protein
MWTTHCPIQLRNSYRPDYFAWADGTVHPANVKPAITPRNGIYSCGIFDELYS